MRRSAPRGCTSCTSGSAEPAQLSLRHAVQPPLRSSASAGQRGEIARSRSTTGPVEQLDRMHDRDVSPRGDLRETAEIAGGDHVRRDAADGGHLALAQLQRKLRLQQVVATRRAAAQMALGYLPHLEAGGPQQLTRSLVDALSVLQRAGGMIGHANTRGT